MFLEELNELFRENWSKFLTAGYLVFWKQFPAAGYLDTSIKTGRIFFVKKQFTCVYHNIPSSPIPRAIPVNIPRVWKLFLRWVAVSPPFIFGIFWGVWEKNEINVLFLRGEDGGGGGEEGGRGACWVGTIPGCQFSWIIRDTPDSWTVSPGLQIRVWNLTRLIGEVCHWL